ncbi:MAG: bifunctional adenosylcobinamide kinase/adenosylcobinamide-phosphate guanylyltransferase [Pseudomonadota bacterium]
MKKVLAEQVFVLGGAASGKSVWAETRLEDFGLPMVYIATAQIFDEEMAARIARHKKRRDARWRTIEAPLQVAEVVCQSGSGEAVLIDCATLWLSNHLLAEADLEHAQSALVSALRACQAPWIIVSNEVGQGVVPENKLARAFREAQGRLNIALAAEATLAVQIVAGIPQVLKGTL